MEKDDEFVRGALDSANRLVGQLSKLKSPMPKEEESLAMIRVLVHIIEQMSTHGKKMED